jgi:hypothetical protein
MSTFRCQMYFVSRSQSCVLQNNDPNKTNFLDTSHNLIKNYVSQTGICLRPQVEPTLLSPIDRAGSYLWTDWAQQSKFYLTTVTDSSLRNVVLLLN